MQDKFKLTLPFSKKQALYVLGSALFVMFTAFMFYLFTDTSPVWYLSLIKPRIMPGETLFAIIQGLLYILAAVVYSLISLKAFTRKMVILMLMGGL